MIELMVATGFLGVGAIALLTCVNASVTNESYAQRRGLILAAAQDKMDATRSTASFGTLLIGTRVSSFSTPGIQSTVTLTSTVTLQSGYTDLYLVDVTASWNEHPGVGLTRSDSIVLDTFIRTNDT